MSLPLAATGAVMVYVEAFKTSVISHSEFRMSAVITPPKLTAPEKVTKSPVSAP